MSLSESNRPPKRRVNVSRTSVGERFSNAVLASTIDTAPLKESSAPADLVELAKVIDAFGVQGWLKISPFGPDALSLKNNKLWWLGYRSQPHHPLEFYKTQVLQFKRHGQFVVAQLAGVGDRDRALAWKNASVLLPRSLFQKPADDEYYWVDLEQCWVYDESNQVIAWVDAVIDNGAHALLQVHRLREPLPSDQALPKTPDFVLDAKGRVVQSLIPFVSAYILSVDIAHKKIVTNFPLDF